MAKGKATEQQLKNLSKGWGWCKGKHICLNTGRTHFKKGAKGFRGKHRPESKEKMKRANLNKRLSPKTEFQKGHIPWNKGKRGIQAGENAPRWKGGRTNLQSIIRQSLTYKEWHHKVLMRDKFSCCECHKVGRKLEIHHIKPLTKILDENKIKTIQEALSCKVLWDLDNGVTLCINCHQLTKKGRGT